MVIQLTHEQMIILENSQNQTKSIKKHKSNRNLTRSRVSLKAQTSLIKWESENEDAVKPKKQGYTNFALTHSLMNIRDEP